MVDCVSLIVLAAACSLIFCCMCANMPRRRVWAREQNLSRRIFAICLPWMRVVVFVSCGVYGEFDGYVGMVW
jgi:hypothetical protein